MCGDIRIAERTVDTNRGSARIRQEWRVTTNVNKCTALVCNELNKPVRVQMEMGRRKSADGRAVYTPWRGYLKRLLLFSKYTHKLIDRSKKAQRSNMDLILRDSHLDARITKCFLMSAIVPKVEYARVWERGVRLVKKFETLQRAATEEILGFSKMTTDTALRA